MMKKLLLVVIVVLGWLFIWKQCTKAPSEEDIRAFKEEWTVNFMAQCTKGRPEITAFCECTSEAMLSSIPDEQVMSFTTDMMKDIVTGEIGQEKSRTGKIFHDALKKCLDKSPKAMNTP